MDGLSGIPTYTPETTKEKFSQEIVNFWPRIYKFINGLFYFLLRTTKDVVTRSIQQLFNR